MWTNINTFGGKKVERKVVLQRYNRRLHTSPWGGSLQHFFFGYKLWFEYQISFTFGGLLFTRYVASTNQSPTEFLRKLDVTVTNMLFFVQCVYCITLGQTSKMFSVINISENERGNAHQFPCSVVYFWFTQVFLLEIKWNLFYFKIIQQ